MSQMPQLSKSRHQRSICAGVTRAGSSTNAVSMRASYQPVSQSAGGELVVAAEALRQRLHVGHRHAEGPLRADPETREVLAVLGRALRLEVRESGARELGNGARKAA